MMATGNDLIEARVRTPTLSRRLSSFSFADWIPHANCTSWGCLGLAHGDRHDRSQNCSEDSPNRRRRPDCRLDGREASQAAIIRGSTLRPIAQMNPTSSRAIAVITTGAFFRRASIRRYRAQRRSLRLPGDGADFGRNPFLPTLHGLSDFRRHAGKPKPPRRSISARRCCRTLVMLVGRRVSPLERSPGTKPR